METPSIEKSVTMVHVMLDVDLASRCSILGKTHVNLGSETKSPSKAVVEGEI
jgi:hypothetical protein